MFCDTAVILQIFGVVLFSVFSVVNGFTEIKKTPKCENALSDYDSSHQLRNLNYTERSAVARHRNLNAPKICKVTVSVQNLIFVLCFDIVNTEYFVCMLFSYISYAAASVRK